MKKHRGRTESRAAKTNKTNKRRGGGSRRREPPMSAKRAGKSKAAGKKRGGGGGHRAAATKTARHKRGGGSNHQGAANGQAENTKAAREHEEPRSGIPTKQTTHSAKAQGTRGRKPEKPRDNGGAKEKKGKKNQQGEGGKENKAQRPRTPAAGNQRKTETKEARNRNNARRKKANKGTTRGEPRPGGGRAKQEDKAAKGKVRRTKTRPKASPPDPARKDEHAHTRTGPGCGVLRPAGGGVGVHTKQPQCTGQVPRRTTDGTEKPDASVTGSTHANHGSARSPRPTPEGPARDNPIAGPRTGTTRREPSAAASAWASGRHNEPGSWPASACPAQPPSKARGASPRRGERHHGVGKADQSTVSDRTGRGAAHHAGPRGTPGRHAAGHNQGTRTGAKQQRPPAAANPESGHNTQRTTAREQVPSNTSHRADGRVRARRVPSPCRLRTAAVWMDKCAPGGYPAPAGYDQPPSGWTSGRPAATPRTCNTACATQTTRHRATTAVNRSHGAQDTAHPTQPPEPAHR